MTKVIWQTNRDLVMKLNGLYRIFLSDFMQIATTKIITETDREVDI
jgi:hypothetical protein